jgi:hypothetical protein
MPDPIKAMQIMSQLNMEGGSEPSAKARSTANDKDANPEKAEKFRQDLEKAKADRVRTSGGGGGAGDTRFLKPKYNAGGKVSEASHKKALEKAGFYDKGTTKSEREKIISKVTTKPQRLGMVEKLFSAKGMKSGGMASKRADGCAIRGKTRA